VQTRKDRIRTDIEYQVALKMQVEIMQLHQKIDRLPEEMASRSELPADAREETAAKV